MSKNPLDILNMTPDEVKRFQTLRITEMAHIAKCEETLENLGFLPQLNVKEQ